MCPFPPPQKILGEQNVSGPELEIYYKVCGHDPRVTANSLPAKALASVAKIPNGGKVCQELLGLSQKEQQQRRMGHCQQQYQLAAAAWGVSGLSTNSRVGQQQCTNSVDTGRVGQPEAVAVIGKPIAVNAV